MKLKSRVSLLVRRLIAQARWGSHNKNNGTWLVRAKYPEHIQVGDHTYGGINVFMVREQTRLTIGRYCSIAADALFILGADHPTNYLSTYPFKTIMAGYRQNYDALNTGDIVIGDDVWVGKRSTILGGVHVGQGAVIGAGAVVTKDVPPYAVVGGSPARILKYRFSPEIIEKLKKIDYSKISMEAVGQETELWYTEINEDNVDAILARIGAGGAADCTAAGTDITGSETKAGADRSTDGSRS